MNRYVVKIKATASSSVVVEAESEEEAREEAAQLAGKLKGAFIWGREDIVPLEVKPYDWGPVESEKAARRKRL